MRISVYSSRELLAVVTSLKAFDREVRKQIRTNTKTMAQPEWQKAVTEHASTRLEQRVLAQTARVQVSDQNVMLQSARIGRSLAGGLKPSESWAPVEFGADRSATRKVETTSRKGNRYAATRHTRAQLRPRNKTGYVVFPAAADMIPRIASLWVQTVVRTIHELIEKR